MVRARTMDDSTIEQDTVSISDQTTHCECRYYFQVRPCELVFQIDFDLCRRNRSLPVSGRATSNAAMIQAATQAITLAYRHEIQRLCIRTDSEFLLNAVRFWMSDWKQNKWRKADGYLLENKEDFQLLDETMDRYWGSLKWEKVSAHSGKHGHEAADRLAREGAAKYDEQSPKYL